MNTKFSKRIAACAMVLLLLIISGCGSSGISETTTESAEGGLENGVGLRAFQEKQNSLTSTEDDKSAPVSSSSIKRFAETENKGNYTIMTVETSKGVESFKLSTFKDQLLAMDTPTKLQTSNRVTACDESGVQIVYYEKDDGSISIDFCDVEVLKAAMGDSYCEVLHSESTFFDMHMGTTAEYLTTAESSMKEVDSDIARSGCYKSVNDGFTVTIYTNGGYGYYFILDVETKLLSQSEKSVNAVSEEAKDDVNRGMDGSTTKETEVSSNGAASGIMSYDDYVAAGFDTQVTVETYVQAKQSWWENKATIYSQNEEGAFLLYNMPCSEEDYARLTLGTKIRVTGFKSEWSGEIEITDGTFDIIDGNYIAPATDVTLLLGTDALSLEMNKFVSFKGMTVEPSGDDGAAFLYRYDGSGSEGDDLYFNVSKNGQTYTFTVESYLCGADTDVYKAVKALSVGDVIDMEGFLYWYNGANPHITSVDVASAQEAETISDPIIADSISDFTFDEAMDFVRVTGLVNKDATVLNIPETVLGKPVQEITLSAFEGNKNLIEVNLPKPLTRLCGKVFKDCSSLEKVTFGDNLEEIDEEAFSGCKKLNNVVLPDEVTIFKAAFKDCESLTEITIPKPVVRFGYHLNDEAFSGCINLTKITISEGLRSIGKSTFAKCNIKELILPESVTSLGGNAFENCAALKSVRINCPKSDIGDYAFYGCVSLETLELGAETSYIGASAFEGCTSLKRVDLPWCNKNAVGIFMGCTALQSVTLPDKFNYSIPDKAFYGCTSLDKIIIPNVCGSIGESAFEGCTSLSEVIFPDFKAFFEGFLEGEISSRAFYGCKSLKSIDVKNCQIIRESAFENCAGLTEIKMNFEHINVLKSAFRGCTGLKELNIRVDNLWDYAFADCTGLTKVNFLEGTQYILENAFMGCSNLTEVNIPDSIKDNKWLGAFADCNKVTINYKGETYSYKDIITLKENMNY